MISSGNKSYGLEVFLQDDGKAIYFLCELEKKGEEISVVKCHNEIEALADVKAKVKADFPLSVIVNGKGIISKPSGDLANPSFAELFPGINSTDFYFYSGNNQGSIIRRKTADGIIESLQKAGLNVLCVFFGLPVIHHCLSALADQITASEITVHGSPVKSPTHLAKADLDADKVKIGNDLITTESLPAYCAALAVYLEAWKLGIDNPSIQAARRDFLGYQKAVKYTMAFLLCILVLIGLSSVAKFYYSNKLQKLNLQEASVGGSSYRDSVILQIQERKRFVKQENWTGSSSLSFYADRLVAEVSAGMALTEMNLFPAKKKSTDDIVVDFDHTQIKIAGTCKDELLLNNWAEGVKKLTWVNDIEVANYEWNSKKGVGEFIVSVNIKEGVK